MQNQNQIQPMHNQNQIQQQQPTNTNDLVNLVRNYVHYDNLTNNYNKQGLAARKLKNDFEHKIIQYLRGQHMENAVIQVSGAFLQLSEEKTAPSLSITNLKKWLTSYYAQKGNSINETDAILRHISLQKNNETQITSTLKKSASPVQLPLPPGQTNNSLKN